MHQSYQNYTWGIDLSGSLQGAGGVGGLLIESDALSGEAYWPSFDGNGNIVSLVKSSDGSLAANYEYDPFGELTYSIGGYALKDPWKFSTKFLNSEVSLYYYGYRYYNPKVGQWYGRDPIEEEGGVNLYGFVSNDGINQLDYLGLLPPWMFVTADLNLYLAWRELLYKVALTQIEGEFAKKLLHRRMYFEGDWVLSNEELRLYLSPIGTITSNAKFRNDLSSKKDAVQRGL